MKENVYAYSYASLKERNAKIARVFSITFGVIIFMTLILNFILFPCLVHSDSMESDIAKNAAVFVVPADRTPKRGQVFYFSSQENKNLRWYKVVINKFVSFFSFQEYEPFGYSHRTTERESIRRVIGLPGDSIYIQDYIVYIRPENQEFFLTEFELASKPYNIHIYSVPAEWDGMGACGNMNELKLGENEYFILADNRIEAVDSRVYGPVSKNRIKGRVILEYFPFNKIRLF